MKKIVVFFSLLLRYKDNFSVILWTLNYTKKNTSYTIKGKRQWFSSQQAYFFEIKHPQKTPQNIPTFAHKKPNIRFPENDAHTIVGTVSDYFVLNLTKVNLLSIILRNPLIE